MLGLDVNLAREKYELKERLQNISKTLKAIESEETMKAFALEDSTIIIEDIESKIKKLEKDLDNFEVAEDFYQIKQEADNIERKIENLHNQIVLKDNFLNAIEKSLQITPDITKDQIKRIYEESKAVFTPTVTKRIEDLEVFYKTLTDNRIGRLKAQKVDIEHEKAELNKKLNTQKKRLDEKLQFLDSKQSLDVYRNVSGQLQDLKQKRDALKKYDDIKKIYDKEKEEINKKLASENIKTINYLKREEPKTKEILKYFKEIAKQFYPNDYAGITIDNEDKKNNQTRYRINAKIKSDGSDGINNVKTFCYDLTLLMKKITHNINFIFHDSRLFNGIDNTHLNEMFNVIRQKFTNKQYIATINENQLDSLNDENQNFIQSRIVTELTDESDQGKLLGETIEINYE